jgi:hypothetical protein
VYHNACDVPDAQRFDELAAAIEHGNASVAVVSDDQIVVAVRARNGDGITEYTNAHVPKKLALGGEHGDAVVVIVRDSDVVAFPCEAQPAWDFQLTVAEAKTQSAVTAVENVDAVVARDIHTVVVGAHASRMTELPHANKTVKVETRRQHLHAVVEGVRYKHKVIR